MAQAKLYVILGSHACRTGMLMLEHKGIPFETVTLPTGMHSVAVRLAGFHGHAPRTIDERPHRALALVDRLGTVPALLIDGERVMGNRKISRELDRLQPQPWLFPQDAAVRARVVEIERWGDEVLQMGARRTILCAAANGQVIDGGARGRLGPLLYHNDLMRRASVHLFNPIFAVGGGDEAGLLASARAMLDEVDGWIADGALDGEHLTAADFMVAPSVALLGYHSQLAAEIEQRPVARMLERIFPRERVAHPTHAA